MNHRANAKFDVNKFVPYTPSVIYSVGNFWYQFLQHFVDDRKKSYSIAEYWMSELLFFLIKKDKIQSHEQSLKNMSFKIFDTKAQPLNCFISFPNNKNQHIPLWRWYTVEGIIWMERKYLTVDWNYMIWEFSSIERFLHPCNHLTTESYNILYFQYLKYLILYEKL